MPRPQKYRDIVRFLRAQGWVLVRQGRGSHEIWGDGTGDTLVVPRHGTVSAGVVRQVIRAFPDTAPQSWR